MELDLLQKVYILCLYVFIDTHIEYILRVTGRKCCQLSQLQMSYQKLRKRERKRCSDEVLRIRFLNCFCHAVPQVKILGL